MAKYNNLMELVLDVGNRIYMKLIKEEHLRLLNNFMKNKN